MKTRQTSAAKQWTETNCLTSDSLKRNAHHTGKQPASARKTNQVSDAARRYDRAPTIEDLIADPSLCVWSSWSGRGI